MFVSKVQVSTFPQILVKRNKYSTRLDLFDKPSGEKSFQS